MANVYSAFLPKRLIFLGAPGVGKGSYASKLTKQWNIPHISTGDMIRAEIKTNSHFGKQLVQYANAGKLVPDELVNDIAKNRLEQPDCQEGWLLDGFPRTIPQAEQLSKFATPSLCVNLFLPDEILVEKLSARRVCEDCGANYNFADIRYGEYDMPPLLPKPSDCDKCHGNPKLLQRADDTVEVVSHRLQIYKDETAPLVDYYSKQGLLLNFHVKKGMQDLPIISEIILEALSKK